MKRFANMVSTRSMNLGQLLPYMLNMPLNAIQGLRFFGVVDPIVRLRKHELENAGLWQDLE